MSKNDITGDSISSKPLSEEGRNRWDKIFGKKKTAYEWIEELRPGEVIYDPDGWRYDDGVALETPITEQDFNRRYSESTILSRNIPNE